MNPTIIKYRSYLWPSPLPFPRKPGILTLGGCLFGERFWASPAVNKLSPKPPRCRFLCAPSVLRDALGRPAGAQLQGSSSPVGSPAGAPAGPQFPAPTAGGAPSSAPRPGPGAGLTALKAWLGPNRAPSAGEEPACSGRCPCPLGPGSASALGVPGRRNAGVP